MFGRVQKIFLGLAMLAGISVSSVAQAQTFSFQGSTAGCFNAGCSLSPLPTSTANLTFTPAANFQGTTSNGFLAIGGSANNFGTFTVNSGSAVVAGTPFTLGINFSLPAGTTPSSTIYSATVFGSVTAGTNGGYQILFNNPTRSFVFSEGTFSLSLNNVSITAGGTNDISGFILAVPGPIAGAGIPALVLGLVAFSHLRRRRSGASA